MEDMWLFAHVGARVPLNYSMLERLVHQGHTHASGGYKHDDVSNEAGLEQWELQVTRHVAAWATARLRTVMMGGRRGWDGQGRAALGAYVAACHGTMEQTHGAAATRCRVPSLCSLSLS